MNEEESFINELLKLGGVSELLLESPKPNSDYKTNANVKFSEENRARLGPEYEGKDYAAVQKLMTEHRGFIRNAFHRKDIGDIALVWGDDKKGLCHIIKRRKETRQPLGKLLQSLTEVITNGSLERGFNDEFKIRYKGKTVVTMAHFYDDKLQFVVIAFYEH